MDRTSAAGHVNRMFVSEDLATNRPPTAMSPVDFNAWQEEIVNVIEGSDIVPSAADNSQLLQALVARFATISAMNSQITDAVAALVNSSPSALDTLNELAAALGSDPNFAASVNSSLASRMRYFAQNQPLPTEDIGPIWHAHYNSIMTWQVFDYPGGFNYGYASQYIGELRMETQPTPRTGYIASGSTHPRATFPQLRNWAIHNGIMVEEGAWAAGTIAMYDNLDGVSFTVFDVRGEFPRFLDGGRGVDLARAFGSWQNMELQLHDHPYFAATSQFPQSGSNTPCFTSNQLANTGATGGAETRPRNTALLATIKF